MTKEQQLSAKVNATMKIAEEARAESLEAFQLHTTKKAIYNQAMNAYCDAIAELNAFLYSKKEVESNND